MSRCTSSAPDLHTVPCELEQGHPGLHRSNQVTWHWPLEVTVGGEFPDPTVDTDHWVDGKVVLDGDKT